MNNRGMMTSMLTIGAAGAAIYGITKGIQNGTFKKLPQTIENALNNGNVQQVTQQVQGMMSNQNQNTQGQQQMNNQNHTQGQQQMNSGLDILTGNQMQS